MELKKEIKGYILETDELSLPLFFACYLEQLIFKWILEPPRLVNG